MKKGQRHSPPGWSEVQASGGTFRPWPAKTLLAAHADLVAFAEATPSCGKQPLGAARYREGRIRFSSRQHDSHSVGVRLIGEYPTLIFISLSFRLLAAVQIEFVRQVLLRTDGVTLECSRWGKELTLAVCTGSHRRNLTFVFQDREAALSGTARMKFKLLRDCAVLHSVRKLKA